MDRGQIIFFGFAGLIILFQLIKGWRLGFVRQIVRFGGLAAAYMAAFWGASGVVPFLRPLGYPDFILFPIGGMLVALAVYLVISAFGGILFKRTAHQNVGLVWFFYGCTGALMGVAFGLLLTLVAADAVRFLGGIAQAGMSKPRPQPTPAQTLYALPHGPEKPKPQQSFLHSGLVELKHSLEKGPAGEVLKTIDPVPQKVYSIAEKIGKTVSDAGAAERFLNYPGARELASRPEIQALQTNPDILAAARDGRYLDLVKNEKIVKVANDPKIAELIKKFDLEKALDYSLGKQK